MARHQRKPRKSRLTKKDVDPTKPDNRTPRERFIGGVREWAESIIFALVTVTIVHLFIFQPYIVPTPSMAGTVPVGDYIFVSKLHYGPRTPTSIGIPVLKLYIPGLELPSTRLPGFSKPKRGDVFAFHWPPDNQVVDQRQPYLKRLVGLPGDKIQIRDHVLYVNDRVSPAPRLEQHLYLVQLQQGASLPREVAEQQGAFEVHYTDSSSLVLVNGSRQAIDGIRKLPYVTSATPYHEDRTDGIFPEGSGYTIDVYGPVMVPRKGQTVPINDATWPLYETIVTRYEGHTAERKDDGTYVIDGKAAATYTFEMDYFFAMGDNRDDSLDSRFWGFVPEDHLIGKAVMTFFSWDNGPRWKRFFVKL